MLPIKTQARRSLFGIGVTVSIALCVLVCGVIFLEVVSRDTDGVVMQRSENDCAPAVITMILQARKIDVAYDDVRNSVERTEYGASVQQVVRALGSFGISARAWTLTPVSPPNLDYPAILFVDGSHFVVLDSIQTDRVYLRDPAHGRLEVSMDNLSSRWDGVTIVIDQGDGPP